MIGVTAIEPVGCAEDHIPTNDVGEVEVGEAYCSAKAEHLSSTCPVAQSDGKAVWILGAEAVDVLGIFDHIGLETQPIILIHEGDGIEGSLDG